MTPTLCFVQWRSLNVAASMQLFVDMRQFVSGIIKNSRQRAYVWRRHSIVRLVVLKIGADQAIVRCWWGLLKRRVWYKLQRRNDRRRKWIACFRIIDIDEVDRFAIVKYLIPATLVEFAFESDNVIDSDPKMTYTRVEILPQTASISNFKSAECWH